MGDKRRVGFGLGNLSWLVLLFFFSKFVSSLSHAVFPPKANFRPLSRRGKFAGMQACEEDGTEIKRGFFSLARFSTKNKEMEKQKKRGEKMRRGCARPQTGLAAPPGSPGPSDQCH